jgi:ketosteroid isomerase-like protein
VKSNGSVYVSVVFALLVGYFSYQWWFNQNRVVKRLLGELAATVSIPADEADLERIARLARLRQYLVEDIKVTSGRSGQELSSRDAVMAAAAGWKPDRGGNVDFVDVDVKVDGDTARAYATAEVTTRDSRTDEQTLDAREVQLSLVKHGGEWAVSGVELRDPVKAEEPAPPPSRP